MDCAPGKNKESCSLEKEMFKEWSQSRVRSNQGRSFRFSMEKERGWGATAAVMAKADAYWESCPEIVTCPEDIGPRITKGMEEDFF